jgi:hypothetical protein
LRQHSNARPLLQLVLDSWLAPAAPNMAQAMLTPWVSDLPAASSLHHYRPQLALSRVGSGPSSDPSHRHLASSQCHGPCECPVVAALSRQGRRPANEDCVVTVTDMFAGNGGSVVLGGAEGCEGSLPAGTGEPAAHPGLPCFHFAAVFDGESVLVPCLGHTFAWQT